MDNPDLDQSFQNAIIYYNNLENSCQNDNQRRVLKVALILFALQSKNIGERTTGASSLLRSTQENICACFAGTPLELEILPILNFLSSKSILAAMPGVDGTYYITASVQMDNERL